VGKKEEKPRKDVMVEAPTVEMKITTKK